MAFEPPLVEVRNLSLSYKYKRASYRGIRTSVKAVDDVTLSIGGGNTLGLVGESGCGKSSLGRTLLRLEQPSSGSVRILGEEILSLSSDELRRMRRRMHMIFQDPFASINPRMSVREVLFEPLEIHRIGSKAQKMDQAIQALEDVGLKATDMGRYPHEFSGGQLQRVGIARALVTRPEFVVLDEPVSALDVSIQAHLLNLLGDLQQDYNLTYLFIAHDLGVVRQISPEIAVMYRGQIVEIGDRARIFASPQHPYTAALLSAIPIPDPDLEARRQRIVLRGSMPDPTEDIKGCGFASRCWLRQQLKDPEICVELQPPLASVGDGTAARCHFSGEMPGAFDFNAGA